MNPTPRAFAADECRNMMLEQMASCLIFWRDVERERLTFREPEQSEHHARMEGVLFSLLVMFDGGCVSLPAFDISPAPHPDDEAYRCDTVGENWWPSGTVINDTQMYESFPWEKCR